MEKRLAVASLSLEDIPDPNWESGELSAVNDDPDGTCKDESCWADSDEEVDRASDLDREWKRRREQFYNTGYRDGISAGRNDAAQDGFNNGFKDSVIAGYRWGIIKGVTSALAHIPNELKVKLVESEEIMGEFIKLQATVDSITTEDALKLFYDDIQRSKSAEQCESVVQPSSSLSHRSSSDHCAMDKCFQKLKLLLKESPKVDVHLDPSQLGAS